MFTPLKIINTKNKNLASSRNIGLKECHGDIIIQTDIVSNHDNSVTLIFEFSSFTEVISLLIILILS